MSLYQALRHSIFTVMMSCTTLLSGCGGYPKLLNFPFDATGRHLNTPSSELSPSIASNYIVFVSDRNGSQDIYLYNAQERSLVDIPGLNSLDTIASHPSVSEDGRYIVFTASRLGRSDIYIYDRQTTIRRNLTSNLQAEVRHPHISADASRITFEAASDGQWDILVYDRSGKPVRLPSVYP